MYYYQWSCLKQLSKYVMILLVIFFPHYLFLTHDFSLSPSHKELESNNSSNEQCFPIKNKEQKKDKYRTMFNVHAYFESKVTKIGPESWNESQREVVVDG